MTTTWHDHRRPDSAGRPTRSDGLVLRLEDGWDEGAPPSDDDAHEHDDHHDHGHDSDLALLRGSIAFGLGIYLVYLQLSGEIGNYINLRFSWIALAGAAFSLLLGGHALIASLPLRHAATDDDHDHGDHVHRRPRWPALALVATPLALAIVVPAKPLGADAVGGSISFVGGAGASEAASISSADSLEWSVLDWLRAFSFGGAADRLNGKPADVTGFIFRNEGDPRGYLIVSRFLMVHCTADSYAIGMPAKWDGADSFPTDTWVRVRGTVRIGEFDGNTLPVIEATSVEQVAKPGQVYLYQ